MIQTHYISDHGFIYNRALGSVGLIHLGEAAQLNASTADACTPILWDFRYCDLHLPAEFLVAHARTWFRDNLSHASAAKRGFVVKSEERKEFAEAVLGRISAPWPWVVFTDMADALAWLNPNEIAFDFASSEQFGVP